MKIVRQAGYLQGFMSSSSKNENFLTLPDILVMSFFIILRINRTHLSKKRLLPDLYNGDEICSL